jgi:hypothetical protein
MEHLKHVFITLVIVGGCVAPCFFITQCVMQENAQYYDTQRACQTNGGVWVHQGDWNGMCTRGTSN